MFTVVYCIFFLQYCIANPVTIKLVQKVSFTVYVTKVQLAKSVGLFV